MVTSALHDAHLRAALGISSDGMVCLDRSGGAVAWNKAATRLLAPAVDLVAGSHLAEAFVEVSVFEDLRARCMVGETVLAQRLDVSGNDGRRGPVLLTLVPLGDPGTTVLGCTVAIRDISEQTTGQEALAEGEARIRRAEALARTGTFVVNAADGSAQWSEGMYAIHGVDPATFIPSIKTHVALAGEADRAVLENLLARTLGGETLPAIDHRVAHADGTRSWVSIAVEPRRDIAGRVLGLSGVCQDVSARIESEAAVQQALERERQVTHELRQLDALKDEFLATASHELRTPLTSIMGFAALLSTTDERAELVEPIERNAREMHRLIEALLDQARLQSGERTMIPSRFALAPAIATLLTEHSELIDGRDVVLDIAEDAEIEMDREAFEIVLGNLVGNALKYSHNGSVTITAEVGDNDISVAVRDEGPGIAPSHLEHVFEPFYRAPGAALDAPGSGLGLAIVRRYVEKHGGTVICNSRVGAGTTFTLTVPWQSEDPKGS
ncbi:MAG TPA: PAS domain-containing sensor histidine kinase [Nocardioidaceae bacterium]|nr:PAS domain-containing sensor histidine kinase [Nocardioidaceae bacterium]